MDVIGEVAPMVERKVEALGLWRFKSVLHHQCFGEVAESGLSHPV